MKIDIDSQSYYEKIVNWNEVKQINKHKFATNKALIELDLVAKRQSFKENSSIEKKITCVME